MLLEYDELKLLIREVDIRSNLIIEENKGRIYEVLPFLILSWNSSHEINFKNCLNLNPEYAYGIYGESRKEYEIIRAIEPFKLKGFIKNLFSKSDSKILFNGFEDKEIKILKECLRIKNTLFDHRGNIINYPESGGYLDQNAKYMYFLRMYQDEYKRFLNKK